MQHLNLYGQLDRAVEPPFSGRQVTWATAACVVVMLIVYAVLSVSNYALQNELKALQQQQADVAKALSALKERKSILEQDNSLDLNIARLQGDIKFRQRLLGSIDPNSAVMDDGFADHLSGLARQYIDGLWFTEIQLLEGGQELALLGRTRAPEYVPQYLQKLAGEKVFKGHQFRIFRMSTPEEQKNLLAFELRAKEILEP